MATLPSPALLLQALLLTPVAGSSMEQLAITIRQQHMSTVGRQEWLVNSTISQWLPAETAIVVVDMWNMHWCASATTRVAELATPMNEFVTAARTTGMTVIWAPSDVTSFYAGTAPRNNTLALPAATLPASKPIQAPPLPLATATDGGCDTSCKMRSAWTRQIASLTLAPIDFLITAEVPAGTQELWNVLTYKAIKNVLCAHPAHRSPHHPPFGPVRTTTLPTRAPLHPHRRRRA